MAPPATADPLAAVDSASQIGWQAPPSNLVPADGPPAQGGLIDSLWAWLAGRPGNFIARQNYNAEVYAGVAALVAMLSVGAVIFGVGVALVMLTAMAFPGSEAVRNAAMWVAILGYGLVPVALALLARRRFKNRPETAEAEQVTDSFDSTHGPDDESGFEPATNYDAPLPAAQRSGIIRKIPMLFSVMASILGYTVMAAVTLAILQSGAPVADQLIPLAGFGAFAALVGGPYLWRQSVKLWRLDRLRRARQQPLG